MASSSDNNNVNVNHLDNFTSVLTNDNDAVTQDQHIFLSTKNSGTNDIKREKLESVKPNLVLIPIPQKKTKLRTSEDVLHRLKWSIDSIDIGRDTPLCPDEIYIGYKDRFLGICEVPMREYNPEDIPYHRVYYFRSGGPPVEPYIGEGGEIKVREHNWPVGSQLLWDRETRIDLIFNSGRTLCSR